MAFKTPSQLRGEAQRQQSTSKERQLLGAQEAIAAFAIVPPPTQPLCDAYLKFIHGGYLSNPPMPERIAELQAIQAQWLNKRVHYLLDDKQRYAIIIAITAYNKPRQVIVQWEDGGERQYGLNLQSFELADE